MPEPDITNNGDGSARCHRCGFLLHGHVTKPLSEVIGEHDLKQCNEFMNRPEPCEFCGREQCPGH